MRFGADIAERIIKELEKVPNIRYVCKKVGIDHSTFYRWILRHPTFNKEVEIALFLGRAAISGVAETVVIKGVQAENYKASTFWLTHQDPHYMQHAKGRQYALIMDRTANILKKQIEFDGTNFETLFNFYDEVAELYDEKTAEGTVQVYIKAFCDGDMELVELFNIANRRRLKESAEEGKRIQAIKPKEDDGDIDSNP